MACKKADHVTRRLSALSLVVALTMIGMPVPVSAGGDESPPPRALTINGLPLSQVLNRTATGDLLLLAGFLALSDGKRPIEIAYGKAQGVGTVGLS